MPLLVDGELLQDPEIIDILKMIDHDCKEFAGAFYEEDRSRKFRKVWTNIGKITKRSGQDCFVDHAWKHFAVHVRAWYADKLASPHISDKDKDRLHKALIIEHMRGTSQKAEDVVQMAPGTQAFEGDKADNTYISESFGDGETLH
jgi:hypothetical protein